MNTATNLNHPLVAPHSSAPRVQQANNNNNNNNNNHIISNSNSNSGNSNSNANTAVAATTGTSPSITTTAGTGATNNNNKATTNVQATTTPNNNTTATTNGSESDSFANNDGHRTPNAEHLSKTNLYIRGLQPNTSDQDLLNMCSRFGPISSTKAILDKISGCCRGYGFVEFTNPQSAELAVHELTKSGVQAQMAKITPLYNHHPYSSSSHYNQQHHHHQQPHHHHNHHHHHNNNNNTSNNNNNNGNNSSGTSGGGGSSQQHNHQSSSSHNNNADPTNLYIANLPPDMSELELETLLSTYGPVVSTRILRDQSNNPRGVGFARMESRDKCEQIIEQLNGRPCKGSKEPLLVKFADGGSKKRHNNHNNQHHHQHQHHSNNSNNHQHHKVHQDDSRWRDSSNTSDLGSVSSFDHQGNISHSNHLSDLAMMNTLSYPRMQPGFPPTVGPGTAYPAPLGPPTSGPQWIHPGGPGQPYVIPQQMIQAGAMGPSNQAAAAAALHYGHIPQLTSQMQGLQIGHPGGPVGGYLPPQHQWSALWTHPIAQPPQPSMRLPAPMQPPPPSQQQQQQPQQQQSPQSNPMHQQQPPPNPQQQPQPPVTDNKIQIPPMPL